MKKLSLLKMVGFALIAMVAFSSSAYAQCNDCLPVVLPSFITAIDTVHVDSPPPAQKNVYYEEKINFRMPQTTDPLVDLQPGTPGGIAINYFRLGSITGLPSGLSWQLDSDHAADGIYDEADPTPRDGCLIICGTPGQSGTFQVMLDIFVDVPILGEQAAQIPLEFVVLPDSSAGFFLTNNIGCAPLTVEFTNNIPSNGNPNITYFWDFGNGSTSNLEDPDTLTYQDSGKYVVQQEVTIDTFPYFLTRVTVTGSDCNDDFIGAAPPDLYIILENGSGTELVNNDYGAIFDDGANAYPPVDAWTGQVELDLADTYTLRVRDDDPLGDDDCGEFIFTATTSQTTFTDGTHTVQIEIDHYIDVIETIDTVYVDLDDSCNVSSTKELFASIKELSVFPNPTTGIVTIAFDGENTVQDAQLTVSDLLGRVMFEETISGVTGQQNHNVDLKPYGQGVYMLQLQVGTSTYRRKIVVK